MSETFFTNRENALIIKQCARIWWSLMNVFSSTVMCLLGGLPNGIQTQNTQTHTSHNHSHSTTPQLHMRHSMKYSNRNVYLLATCHSLISVCHTTSLVTYHRSLKWLSVVETVINKHSLLQQYHIYLVLVYVCALCSHIQLHCSSLKNNLNWKRPCISAQSDIRHRIWE